MELRILYNGACPICSREVGHYIRLAQRSGAPVAFDDLNTVDLRPWGLDADSAARRLHAIEDGRLLAGVPAFLALWARLPGWRWLARVVALPGVRGLTGLVHDRALAPMLYARSRRRMQRDACALPRQDP